MKNNINNSYIIKSPLKTDANSSLSSESSSSSTTTTDSSQSGEEWRGRPEVWSDDVRMNALFAPFRSRDLNPLHYDNKIKFWKECILNVCAEKNFVQISVDSLEAFFQRKNIKPKCLQIVLDELSKDGYFKSRDEVLKPRIGLMQTMFAKIVWQPITWSTSFIFSYYSSNKSDSNKSLVSTNSPKNEKIPRQFNATLINVNLIEQKSNELLRLMQETVVYKNVDSVIEFERFSELYNEVFMDNEKNFELITKYLEVNQKILVTSLNDQKIVKFVLSLNGVVSELNDMEKSYVELKEAEKKLELEVEKINQQIENLNETIKSCLRQSNKTSALKYLKKRKQLEKSLELKDGRLSNVQTMVMSIHQADSNKETYDVYVKSVEALKEASKGIKLDRLDETMSDLQDLISANAEIEDVLSKSPIALPQGKYAYDEKELNDELNELLAENDESKEASGKNMDKTKSKDKIDSSFDLSGLLDTLPKIPNETPRKNLLASLSSK